MATLDIHPVTLTGKIVRLEPLSEGHVGELAVAGADESIWQWMRYGVIRTEEQMREHVRYVLAQQARGTDLAFAVISLHSGQAIGMTRYMNIEPQNRWLEIGGTWYAVAYQRSGVNTESKYLLLRHAFETLGCGRVQIKTDLRNLRSQRAIERLGAVREGVLRNHMILPDGYVRSSVMYSIIDSEWPGVKARLEELMEQGSKGDILPLLP